MGKIKERITILAIGDGPDHDSYKKFHKEKPFILESGFDYVSTDYKRLLTSGIQPIKTRKVIVFLFFPFIYWDKYIEYRNYKGIYGNHTFYTKFIYFWNKVDNALMDSLSDKKVFFINRTELCGLYRDKLNVAKKFSHAGISNPRLYNIQSVKKFKDLLAKGHSFFLKPRYGSMGKGITYLTWSNWQTNFIFKNGQIMNRISDKGWKFRDTTGNGKFLRALIKKDILIEEAVNSLLLNKMKVDMRIYTFFNKVIYIYPRRNNADKITTNISQGAKGDPDILKKLPGHLIKKAERLAQRVSKTLGLNLTGMDIMMDHNLKDVYVIDVNVFPGFPKRRTFNLAQCMIKELQKMTRGGRIWSSIVK